MESNCPPENPDTFFDLVGEIAEVVAEKERRSRIRQQREVLLRSSLAAVAFVRNADLTMLAEESLRLRLRLRLSQLIGEISLTLSNDDLSKLAGYVLLISA